MVTSSETRIIGTYLALVPLARGGMGEVWIAVSLAEPDPRRVCLIKTVKATLAHDTDTQRRFVDEAQTALRLSGQHLCHVFDAGGVGDELFLAMELIEGVTFKRLLELLGERHGADGAHLDLEAAVFLSVGMLRGLHEAHVAVDAHSGLPLGVVHRDVSPHNVMVDGRGAVKIIDFGLATSVVKQTMTESAVVLGKTAYMAPEQARGEVSTPATDQYAAAIVAYELLTGDRFYGDLPSRAVWSIVGSGRHRPRDLSSLPPALSAVLLRALAPEPADRFSSCAAFAEALLAAAPQAASAATTQRVGALVHSLALVEQQTIAHARELATQLLPTARPELEDATQSMRFRVTQQGSWRPTPSSLSSTEMPTMATARLRPAPPAPLPAPSQRRWLAAAAGGGLLLALLVGGAWVMRRAAPATTTTTSTTTTTAPSSPPPAGTATTPNLTSNPSPPQATPPTMTETANSPPALASSSAATTTDTRLATSPPAKGRSADRRSGGRGFDFKGAYQRLRDQGCQQSCIDAGEERMASAAEHVMQTLLKACQTACNRDRGPSP